MSCSFGLSQLKNCHLTPEGACTGEERTYFSGYSNQLSGLKLSLVIRPDLGHISLIIGLITNKAKTRCPQHRGWTLSLGS